MTEKSTTTTQQQQQQVENLQESELKPGTSTTRHQDTDAIPTDSESTDDEDGNVPRQELEMVISALQTTVLQAPKETALEPQDHQAADELHSGDDDDCPPSQASGPPETGGSSSNRLEETPQTHDHEPPSPGAPPPRETTSAEEVEGGGRRGRSTNDDEDDDMADMESFSANLIALHGIDLKEIKPNQLSPREQEKAGMYLADQGGSGRRRRF